MDRKLKGYTGRQLRIRLSERESYAESLDFDAIRKFIGGTGYACKILYNELQAGIDPLGPDNKLIFATGPLCSNTVHGGGSIELCFKSPLTGGWGEARSGSDFGPTMRRTGFDFLIIEGRSDTPIYLIIQNNVVTFLPADHLVGKTISEKISLITPELPPGKFSIAAIGPAGENLVRFAAVMFGDRAAARGGPGAVMGSKNLLAIAVDGNQRIEPANKEALISSLRKITGVIRDNPASSAFQMHGTMGDYAGNDEKGDMPTKNWQANSFGNGNELFDYYENYNLIKSSQCYHGCIIGCERKVRVDAGPYATPSHGGAEYETLACFTSYQLSTNMDAAIHCGYLCNQYGLDTISAGATIAFAMECAEKGILSPHDLGGLDLSWGNSSVMPLLLGMIARRDGIGNLLAEGVRRASNQLGQGSEAFAIHVKGMEGPAHDGRSGKALAISYGTANRGMCHIHPLEAMAYDSGKMDWGLQKYGLKDPMEVDRWDESGKGIATKLLQDGLNLPEILCTCKFFMYAGITVDHWADILSSITGCSYTGADLLYISERVNTLQRLFNIREGFTVEDDQLPERIKSIPNFGKYKDEKNCIINDYNAMLREYYTARGWEPETGIPTKETLDRLCLN